MTQSVNFLSVELHFLKSGTECTERFSASENGCPMSSVVSGASSSFIQAPAALNLNPLLMSTRGRLLWLYIGIGEHDSTSLS